MDAAQADTFRAVLICTRCWIVGLPSGARPYRISMTSSTSCLGNPASCIIIPARTTRDQLSSASMASSIPSAGTRYGGHDSECRDAACRSSIFLGIPARTALMASNPFLSTDKGCGRLSDIARRICWAAQMYVYGITLCSAPDPIREAMVLSESLKNLHCAWYASAVGSVAGVISEAP